MGLEASVYNERMAAEAPEAGLVAWYLAAGCGLGRIRSLKQDPLAAISAWQLNPRYIIVK